MQNNWKKTTITFTFGNEGARPVKIVMQNAIAAPATQQVEAFGGYLATLTGIPFISATVNTQKAVA
ncbi:hypothetical protein [Levilactobacillus yonginensis]|uniref:hypothetical protein n=1 Tax=Levilactobacillus yonginensis TaxID=1054041 RepID=UPI000F7795FA|nr:hypothetical protein [Levilactobacillus yonginensis]